MNNPLKLIQDLQEAGIVKGGGPQTRRPAYSASKAPVKLVDPQDALDVEEAFQEALKGLLGLGDTLLRSGPPSSTGAAERLAYIRQQLTSIEQDLGITAEEPAPAD